MKKGDTEILYALFVYGWIIWWWIILINSLIEFLVSILK